MKESWEMKKLGEVCDVLNGLWIGKKEPFVNICVIRNTNFTKDCKLNLDNVAYIDAEAKQFATRKLKVGDIIIEKSGGSEKQPVGRVVLFNVESGDYSFSNFTSTLRIKPNTELNPCYLHKCLYAYYLRGETFKLQSKTTGLHNLDMKGYLRLPIPIPSLAEQEKIVAELDCLSGIIEKKKQQLKEYDALAQSIFYEMFGDPVENEKGWEEKKIKDISVVKIGPFGSLLHTSDYVSGGTPLVNPVHMQNEIICPDNDFTVSEEKISELQNYILHEGDIIFARRGDIGRCALVRDIDDGFLCGTGSLFVRMTKPVNTIFFVKMMRSTTIIKHLNSLAKGATMLNINCKIIEDFPIILPPLSLQQKFASKIEAIEKQKALIKKSIEEVETLFNSRMDLYFN